MAEAEYNSDEGTEAVLDSNDHRVQVDERNNSTHPVHSVIFQVRAVCDKCDSSYPGTCFMVEELNRMQNTGDFYYFVTAGHVLYCIKCRDYFAIQISYEWEPNDGLPKVCFMPPNEFVLERSTRGWLSVPDGYKSICDQDKSANERHPYDYGVIAMRKDQLTHEMRTELDTLVSANAMLRAPGAREEYVRRAFLCGYPCTVKGKYVRGKMHWVPEESSKEGEPLDAEANRRRHNLKERNCACLYPMPQVHMGKTKTSDGEGTGNCDTNAPLAVQRLFRHYIDSSGGQSGSPIYRMSDDDADKEEYHAVGIHLGFWKIQGVISYNVALRLSEVVKEMKEWIKANHGKQAVSDGKKAGTESFEEKFYKTYLLSTGIEGMPPKRDAGPSEPPVDEPTEYDSNPWDELEFITEHRGWITSLPAASLLRGCIKAGLLTQQADIKKLTKIRDEEEHNSLILEVVMPGERTTYEIFLVMLEKMNPDLYKKRVLAMRKLLNR